MNISISPEIIGSGIPNNVLLSDICRDINTDKPLMYIILAFIFDFTEMILRKYYRDKILFKLGFYEMRYIDLIIMFSAGKSICMLIAAVLLLMGSSAWMIA